MDDGREPELTLLLGETSVRGSGMCMGKGCGVDGRGFGFDEGCIEDDRLFRGLRSSCGDATNGMVGTGIGGGCTPWRADDFSSNAVRGREADRPRALDREREDSR